MKSPTIKEVALDFAVEIVNVCDNIKGREVFVNQIIRSSSSIGANAYEANYAQSKADFIHKLEISLKECYETEYWLELLYKVQSLSEENYNHLRDICGSIRRKLISAITNSK